MAFIKKEWADRIVEFANRRRLTFEDGSSQLVTVSREEGDISEEGDAFSAENMNELEERIEKEFSEINSNLANGMVKFQIVDGELYYSIYTEDEEV